MAYTASLEPGSFPCKFSVGIMYYSSSNQNLFVELESDICEDDTYSQISGMENAIIYTIVVMAYN